MPRNQFSDAAARLVWRRIDMDVLSDPVPKKADAKQGAALRMVHELRRVGLVDLLPME